MLEKLARLLSFGLVIGLLFSIQPQSASAAACTTPTQSSLTESGTTYTLQTFTTVEANCTWAVPTNVSRVQLVIVGGGGGAAFGSCGGGGGAGRVIRSNSSLSVTSGSSLTLTIGGGGLGGFRLGWVMGVNGDTSSAVINGITYNAAGGGGGGGGAGSAAGLSGGSGGGGAACGGSSGGGSADTSVISGFTTYGFAGAAGSGNGGGGGGAGAAATNNNGGAGITLWGATIGGGGGGWGNGTGGSGGGGSATSSYDTQANAGTAGSAGTGGGGGGGNNGGSGRIMIRYLVDATISSPSLSGTPYKGISVTITITSNTPGVARFFAASKKIANCLSRTSTGSAPTVTATCIWKPTNQGYINISATFTPTDINIPAVSSALNKVFVLKRTTSR